MKMLIKSIPFLLIIMVPFYSIAQSDFLCDGYRYLQNTFEDSSMTTVSFGSNFNDSGELQELFADVYEPKDDEALLRPLLIWVFGGSFINGDRTIMEPYCMEYVKKGYVSATIDYRLAEFDIFNLPDSIESFDIMTRAASDVKAAIRYFRYSIEEEGNPYRIDTDQIYLGGISSGSIAAIQAAVLDDEDDPVLSDWMKEVIDNNGGFSGNTNPETIGEYNAKVNAVINYAGAILDTAWIDENDPPVLGIHGDIDENVDIGKGFARVFFFEIIELYGSSLIAEQQENLGMNPIFYPVDGADHYSLFLDPMHENARTSFRSEVQNYIYNQVCPELPLSTKKIATPNYEIYPNPSADILFVESVADNSLDIKIHDINGRLKYQAKSISEVIQIPIHHYINGYYYLVITDKFGQKKSYQFIKL